MLMDRTCFVLPSGSSRLKDSLGGSKGDDAAHRVAMLSTTAPALLNSIILALFLPLATALDCAPRPYVAPLFSQYLVFRTVHKYCKARTFYECIYFFRAANCRLWHLVILDWNSFFSTSTYFSIGHGVFGCWNAAGNVDVCIHVPVGAVIIFTATLNIPSGAQPSSELYPEEESIST